MSRDHSLTDWRKHLRLEILESRRLLAGTSGFLTAAPLVFEPNVGQGGDESEFVARGLGYELQVAGDRVTMASSGGQGTSLRFVGAKQDPQVEPEGLLSGVSHYYVGNEPANWVEGLANYSRLAIRDVYDGIDVLLYGTDQGELEYDFVVSPGVSPGAIRVAFDERGRTQVGC